MSDKKADTKKRTNQLIALSTTGKEHAFKNPLDMKIKYQGQKIDMKIHEDSQGFSYFLWKNKKYPVEIIEKNQNKYTVMLNGVWHTYTVETPFSLKRKKYLESQEGSSSTVLIEAPMPGKIIDILVEEGTEVISGEPVVILEAMKMQNEISSHVNGTITKISVRKNDSVMKDDVLIEIARS